KSLLGSTSNSLNEFEDVESITFEITENAELPGELEPNCEPNFQLS
ncbi:34582_t:CDS:1, partial [Gigaspora margarita]